MEDSFIPDSFIADSFIPEETTQNKEPILTSAARNVGQGLTGISQTLNTGAIQAINAFNPIPSENTLVQIGKTIHDAYTQGKLGSETLGLVKSFYEPVISDIKAIQRPVIEKGPIEGSKQALEVVARRPFDYLMDTLMFADFGGKAISGAGVGVAKSSAKVSENIINSLIKPKERQFAYGKNPGRGVAREGIVATSMEDLSKKISEKKAEVGQKIESTVSNPKYQYKLNFSAVTAPLDEAIAKAKENPRSNSAIIQRLNNHKLDILGAVEDANGNIIDYKRDFSRMTPKEAWEVKKSIGEQTKFTGNISDDKLVNSALKKTYGNIDRQLDAVVPNIRDLNHRYADLLGADIATKHREIIATRNNIFGLPEVIIGTGAGYTAGAKTGVGAALIYRALSSTLGKTLAAKILSKGVAPAAEAIANIPSANSPSGIGAVIARSNNENQK